MSNAPYNKPIPNLNDPDFGPFWSNAKLHILSAQKCVSCGTLRFPALPICPECLELGFDWVPVSTRGTIWSYAIYHRSFHPGFKDELPYAVGIIENSDGVRYTGRIRGPREQISVGAEVATLFVDETEDFTLPQWELVPSD
jgi:uncharacterized OB-fold protein